MASDPHVPAVRRRRVDALVAANVAFVTAVALHAVDHLTQERGVGALSSEVVWGGTVVFLLAAASLALSVVHHPRAPLLSAVVGLWTAVAVSASHLAPHWSAFSDSYADLSLPAYSWAAALAEIAAALVLGLVGLRALRRAPAAQPSRSNARTAS
jgi:hypothetical protein